MLITQSYGISEIRQQEFRDRHFDSIEFPVYFQNSPKLHRNFDNVVKFPQLLEFRRSFRDNNLCWLLGDRIFSRISTSYIIQ